MLVMINGNDHVKNSVRNSLDKLKRIALIKIKKVIYHVKYSIKNSLDKFDNFQSSSFCFIEILNLFSGNDNAGIAAIASDLDLSSCNKNSKMCQFLHLHFGATLKLSLNGMLLAKKIKFAAKIDNVMWLAAKLRFGSPIMWRMSIDENGDRVVLESDLFIQSQSTGETFPGMLRYSTYCRVPILAAPLTFIFSSPFCAYNHGRLLLGVKTVITI